MTAAEDREVSRHYDWTHQTAEHHDEERCPKCGAVWSDDEPCDLLCPEAVSFAVQHTDDAAADYALDVAEMWEE